MNTITLEQFKELSEKYGALCYWDTIKDGTFEQVEQMFKSIRDNNLVMMPMSGGVE